MLQRALRALRKIGLGAPVKRHRKMRTRASLASALADFEKWRCENPGLPAWHAYAPDREVLSGKQANSTIGTCPKGKPFQESGLNEFNKLLALGLKADDICVDYGCGTLRVGQHVIRYIGPGCYWGFDIHGAYLEAGRNLMDGALIAEKRPHLRVISANTVTECASHQPSFVFFKQSDAARSPRRSE
jgi:hypothetical protein